MWSVDSRSANKISRIPTRTSSAIKAWWLGRASAEEKAIALEEIKTAHTRLQWFGCDCVTSGEIPTLAPALRKETYFLRRLTARAHHQATCPFNFEQADDARQGNQDAQGVAALGGAPDFGPATTGKIIKDRSPDASSSGNNGPRSEQTPKLAKRLWWLLQASGNQMTRQSSPIPNLMELIATIPFGATMRLKDAFFYSTKAIDEGWVDACLQRQAGGEATPTCWVLFEITSVNQESKTITVSPRQSGGTVDYPVDGPLRIWGGDVSPIRFPMLGLARIEGNHLGKRIAELYAHPTFKAGSWMLVDSDNERQTLHDLISVGKWLWTEKEISTTIEKPLFEWNRTGEKPDFVMTLNAPNGVVHHCVIETMGYEDDGYMQRKIKLRTNLMRHAEVIMDYRATNTQASHDLKSAIARWAMRTKR
jgi:hypothetical protein